MANEPKPISIDDFVKRTNASSNTATAPKTDGPKPISIADYVARKSPAQPAAPSETRSGVEKFTDVIGAKGITDLAASKIAEANVESTGPELFPGQYEQQRKILQKGEPSAKDVAGSALQVGSMFLPYARIAKGVATGLKALGASEKVAKFAAPAVAGATGGAVSDTGLALNTQTEDPVPVGTNTVLGATLPLAAGLLGPVGRRLGALASKSLVTKTPQAAEIAGKIVQGDLASQKVAAKVIPTIDTKGVSTYSQLSGRLDDAIKKEVKTVSDEFGTVAEPVKLNGLSQTVKVSAGEGVKALSGKINYVSDAIQQLGDFYRKTRDLPNALRIKALIQKAQKTGLTPAEVNEIAKEHGRVLTGFNASGELASGLSKQAAENTRKGLKETARGFLKTDTAKNADKKASELIRTKELVDEMAEKVSKLQQRVNERSLGAKIGRATSNLLDMFTGGILKGAVGAFFPSNVGLKVLNSLDLQEQLAKNLQILARLSKAPDSEVITTLRNLFGNEIKSKK